jgi:hypothetical protein
MPQPRPVVRSGRRPAVLAAAALAAALLGPAPAGSPPPTAAVKRLSFAEFVKGPVPRLPPQGREEDA